MSVQPWLVTGLVGALALAGCGGDHTFLLTTITRGNVAAATPIRGLETTIDLDGHQGMTPVLSPGAGAGFSLPATLSLEVASGDGTAIVGVNAYGDGSALLSAGSTELVFARGDTTEVTVELGRHMRLAPDAAVDDQSVISISPAVLNFGTRTVGTTREETLTVGNSGTGPSQPLMAALSGVDASRFTPVSDACTGTSLPASQTCTVVFAFGPTAVGSSSATVVVKPYEATTTGGVMGAGVLFSLTPSSLGFGAVALANSVTQTATIKNESTTTATQAVTWTITGVNPSEFAIDTAMSTCTAGQTLNPNTSCTVVVRFAPVTAGTKTANLNVTDRGTMSLALTGTGT